MIKHHMLCHTQNLPINSSAKKESIFNSPNLLKATASAFLMKATKNKKLPSSLVYINKIKDNNIIPDTQWKRLNTISRLFYIFTYAEQQQFYAVSLRFSHSFINKIESSENQADFIRRRINANFKLKLGYIPQYSFILEKDKKSNIHLHGIMEITDAEQTKNILKLTCFGKDYKHSNMNKYIYKYEPLYSSWWWCSYCLKGKFAKNKVILSYASQELTAQTREQFNMMRQKNINKSNLI